MNILFVFSLPIISYLGGVQRVTSILSNEFIKLGNKVTFLSTIKENTGQSNQNACIQKNIDMTEGSIDKINKDYLDLLVQNNVDIIIFQELSESNLYLLSITPKHLKTICCIHTKPFFFVGNIRRLKLNTPTPNFRSFITKYIGLIFPFLTLHKLIKEEKVRYNRALEYCDILCLLSSRYYGILKKYLPNINNKQLYSIPNPNTYTFKEYFPKKEKIILFVARLENNIKNVTDFINICSFLLKENLDWKAIIVGDGPDRIKLEKYAKYSKVERLEFVGLQKDVTPFYEKASIYCMTSRSEGWPMTITEAMMHGCVPVCYGSFQSVYDIIDDNVNGYITEPFSIINMKSKIQLLIDNPIQRDKLAKNAHLKVKQFDASLVSDKWVNLFNELNI